MNEALEQLEQEIATAENDEERVRLLNREASNLSRVDPRTALRLAKRALNIAAADHNAAGQSESYCTIGICHLYLANHSVALSSLRKAYRIAGRIGDSFACGRALANLGVVLIRIGHYPQALDTLMQALEIFEKLESRSFISMVRRNLGVLYGDIGDYAKSLDHYHQSLRIKEELGEPVAGDLNNIGGTLYTMGQTGKAREYFRQSFELHKIDGDRIGQAMALTNIAEAWSTGGAHEEAREAYQQALEIYEELGDRSSALYALLGVAAYYRQTGDFATTHRYLQQAHALAGELKVAPRLLEVLVEEAELLTAEGAYAKAVDTLSEVLRVAVELGDVQSIMVAHRQLSFIHEQLGDIPAAFAHHKEADRIRGEILSQEKQHEVTSMQMRYEVEKAEQERELLKMKNQQLHLEMQTRMKELTSLAMQLVQKNEMLDELKQQIALMASTGNGSSASANDLAPLLRQIESTRNSEHEWEVFEEQFRTLHPEFMDRMAREFSELTPTELKVCALLKINLSTKDIANILCCSTRTVEDHRYAIRTKIGLPKGVNLTSHLMGT